MSKIGSRSNQKVYKMRGCSKKTRKNHLGGSADAPLAYTGKPVFSVPNPNLAYTGNQPILYTRGGGYMSSDMLNKSDIPVNTNARNPIYPNTGPIPRSDIIFNTVMPQHGGSCPSCSAPLMSGGCCGSGLSGMNGGRRSKKNRGGTCGLCAMGFMVGGKKHRIGCKCSDCKSIRISGGMKGGNPGIPYPGGLTGTPWTPNNLPGQNGIAGDSNHYALNTYSNGDPQTSMVDVGANSPFLYMKGGKRKQKGGTLSNFIGQDLINLGRQFQFGLGSAYNALAGYSSPINPMPWKGQFPVGAPMNPVRPIV